MRKLKIFVYHKDVHSCFFTYSMGEPDEFTKYFINSSTATEKKNYTVASLDRDVYSFGFYHCE